MNLLQIFQKDNRLLIHDFGLNNVSMYNKNYNKDLAERLPQNLKSQP
jgi:hypothetical protein